jgi:5-aminolevulinate synthase
LLTFFHSQRANLLRKNPQEHAAAAKKRNADATAKETAAAGCPFHLQSATATRPVAASFAPWPAPTPAPKPKEHLAFNYEGFYANELDKKHQDKSYRYFNNINRLAAKFPVAHTSNVKEEVEVWCANDYLGMGNNPVVLETMQCVFYVYLFFLLLYLFFFLSSRTLDKYGHGTHGTGGTRNIAGNGAMHLSLEQELANLHQEPAALVFSSCYVANDATLSTLGAKLPGCIFFSDTMNHASMIQGMRHSGR